MPDSHHPVSHHQNDPDKLVKLSKVNLFHSKQFAYFVERMAAAQDGDGSLLDHSMLLYGAGISDSNVHMHDNLPLVLAGGGAGRIKGGRHVRYPKDTPVTNLFLNMLDKLASPPIPSATVPAGSTISRRFSFRTGHRASNSDVDFDLRRPPRFFDQLVQGLLLRAVA